MKTSTSTPLNIGIIGVGGRGSLGLLAHRPDLNVRVAALCDLEPSAMLDAEQKIGASCLKTADYRELIAQPRIDAVFVCTPDFLHEEHGLAVLRAGKGLYLEKPMAITIEACDRLLAEARHRDARLFLGHNMRFFPVMQKMKQLIEGGAIGRVEAIWCRHFISYGGDAYFKDWHSERRYSNGLLLQKGAHDIDVIHWLAGAYTSRVTALGKLSVYNENRNRRVPSDTGKTNWSRDNWPPSAQTGLSPIIDVEDHSMVLMQLANGVQASYLQCHYTPDDHRNYTIIGTEGRIENCGDYSDGDHLATIRLWNRRCGYQEEGLETFKIPSTAGTHGGSDPVIVEDFIHYLRTGIYRGATPLDARMSVAAGIYATSSLRANGIPHDIPPPQDYPITPASAPARVTHVLNTGETLGAHS
jgi:predicted dehydrogenase